MDEDYYYDDPEESASTSKRITLHKLISVAVISIVTFGGVTFASNISLVNGGKQEFGQGVLQAVACSGNNAITVKPISAFQNVSGGGSFAVSGFSVEGVPSSCNGYDFAFNFYDDSSSAARPIYSIDSDTVKVAMRLNTFNLATNATGISIVKNSDSSFKVSFSSPVLLSSSTYRVSVQSGPGQLPITLYCGNGGSCSVGGTGPGGGTIFKYVSAGFNCGPTNSPTGSPTGAKCRYLEVAPAGWFGSTPDPSKIWADAAYQSTSLAGTVSTYGGGYLNSLLIIAQGNGSNTAAAVARAYSGGGLSDWYLPTDTELVDLKTYVSTSPFSSLSPGLGFNRVGGYNDYGYYWTSTQHINANMAWIQGIVNGGGGMSKSQNLNVRPIRAF